MVRTRSVEAHDKVLRAALDLFAERGIEATSMDAIAQASGVSKATIYNHWSDKEGLLLEVMDLIHGLNRQREDVDTGDICKDLTWVLTRRPPDEFDELRTRLTPSLIAYSAHHQAFGAAWRHRVLQPARECIQRIIRRGMQRGLLRKVDPDLAVALLLGPALYTHIFFKDHPQNKPDIGAQTAESFWRAWRTAKGERIKTGAKA
jgi:AcrR family transcriptional regulator